MYSYEDYPCRENNVCTGSLAIEWGKSTVLKCAMSGVGATFIRNWPIRDIPNAVRPVGQFRKKCRTDPAFHSLLVNKSIEVDLDRVAIWLIDSARIGVSTSSIRKGV